MKNQSENDGLLRSVGEDCAAEKCEFKMKSLDRIVDTQPVAECLNRSEPIPIPKRGHPGDEAFILKNWLLEKEYEKYNVRERRVTT